MQFQLATIFTALLAATGAAALPQSANKGVKFSLKARDSINDCGDSTFINQSSGGSPLVSDCQQIATNIAGGGTWTVSAAGEQHQLVQYGTCAFGVQGQGDLNAAYIGNQDIIDVINTSIQMFQWNGLVGAKGTMGCQSLEGLVSGAEMTWGIYHT